MNPWQLLDRVLTPDGTSEMTLHRRGEEFSIRIGYAELMNSRQHYSEEAMAELACAHLATAPTPRVLIGGLGMGFTVAATNAVLPASAHIDVAELLPAVVRWNRAELGECAGRPLDDERVRVHEGDVCALLAASVGIYDAIMLDVDNGPEGLTQPSNRWLYDSSGLASIKRALRPVGVLSVWSAHDDSAFTTRLGRAGFTPTAHRVRSRKSGKGSRHTVWVATLG
jgi:spermidine synthase